MIISYVSLYSLSRVSMIDGHSISIILPYFTMLYISDDGKSP